MGFPRWKVVWGQGQQVKEVARISLLGRRRCKAERNRGGERMSQPFSKGAPLTSQVLRCQLEKEAALSGLPGTISSLVFLAEE